MFCIIFSMHTKRAQRGISKQEWLEIGLKSLSEDGIAGLKVERLAKELGIARAGFYWHFKSREDLQHQLLEYWVHELTEVVTTNADLLALEPRRILPGHGPPLPARDFSRVRERLRAHVAGQPGAGRGRTR